MLHFLSCLDIFTRLLSQQHLGSASAGSLVALFAGAQEPRALGQCHRPRGSLVTSAVYRQPCMQVGLGDCSTAHGRTAGRFYSKCRGRGVVNGTWFKVVTSRTGRRTRRNDSRGKEQEAKNRRLSLAAHLETQKEHIWAKDYQRLQSTGRSLK